jgi:hypothetical protein
MRLCIQETHFQLGPDSGMTAATFICRTSEAGRQEGLQMDPQEILTGHLDMQIMAGLPGMNLAQCRMMNLIRMLMLMNRARMDFWFCIQTS